MTQTHYAGMTKCKGPHHDFDDFTTYGFTTVTTLQLLIDLETRFCTVNPVSRSITSGEVVKVVRSSSRDVVLCTLSYQGVLEISFQV